jgi:hypothetical protein
VHARVGAGAEDQLRLVLVNTALPGAERLLLSAAAPPPRDVAAVPLVALVAPGAPRVPKSAAAVVAAAADGAFDLAPTPVAASKVHELLWRHVLPRALCISAGKPLSDLRRDLGGAASAQLRDGGLRGLMALLRQDRRESSIALERLLLDDYGAPRASRGAAFVPPAPPPLRIDALLPPKRQRIGTRGGGGDLRSSMRAFEEQYLAAAADPALAADHAAGSPLGAPARWVLPHLRSPSAVRREGAAPVIALSSSRGETTTSAVVMVMGTSASPTPPRTAAPLAASAEAAAAAAGVAKPPASRPMATELDGGGISEDADVTTDENGFVHVCANNDRCDPRPYSALDEGGGGGCHSMPQFAMV